MFPSNTQYHFFFAPILSSNFVVVYIYLTDCFFLYILFDSTINLDLSYKAIKTSHFEILITQFHYYSRLVYFDGTTMLILPPKQKKMLGTFTRMTMQNVYSFVE